MYIASRLCGIHQLVWCTLLYLFLFCRSGKAAFGGVGTLAVAPGGNCSNAVSCTSCISQFTGCVWCLVKGACIPVSEQGQCTNPYTDCCVTFSPQGCPACLANNNCGWCSNQGCRQGNNTGPNGGTGPCTGSWAYGSGCPGGDGGDSEDLTVLVGVGVSVAFGTCFALFVISLLVILVMKRWRQREAQKDLMQYERQRRRKSGQLSAPVNNAYEESSLSTTPDREAYSSLAPLIRNWNIEQGNTDYETLKRVEEATKD